MKDKLRIAYIGNFMPLFSTENDVRKAWEFLGHEVIAAQENELNWDQLFSYDYDLLLHTGTWPDVAPLTQFLDLYKGCADRGIPTCTLHLDTFWGTSRDGRRWWLEPMFHTAHIFTADGDYQDKWKALGKNHHWLPPAIRHDAVHKGVYREEYRADVGFAGSCGVGYHEDIWPYRRQLIDALKEICSRNNWSFSNPGGELDKPDAGKISRGDDMNNWYASVKVTVGDSLCLKKDDSHYWSDRVPEATGRGGLLIMPHISQLDYMYQGELPMYPWGDFDQLEETIKYWLDHDEERLEQIDKTFARTSKDHRYTNRVKEMLSILQKEGAL